MSEPRNDYSREPAPFASAPAAPERRLREAPRSYRGQGRQRTHRGIPRNLGGPAVSVDEVSAVPVSEHIELTGKDGGKSEPFTVPTKQGNRAEGTLWREGEAGVRNRRRERRREPWVPKNVSTRLQRIAKLAKDRPGMVFTTLAHHIDEEWLQEAHRLTRKDGAAGVDEQTAQEYAANLEENLASLHERLKSGTYRAPPVKRVHIPKGDGSKTRPIGIPTFEDKVLQRAVAMVLEAIYEQDFLDCSFGFRPGRSAHHALERLWNQAMRIGAVVLEVDIQAFFDSLDHGHLRGFLDQRVRDGVIRRVIDKWLKAGVLEKGSVSYPEAGTPQGGVISPLLANVYLHEVIDKWFASEVRPRLQGSADLVRYADDFVVVFSSEADALRVLDVLPKRLAKYGLTMHPTKTRLVPFRPPGPGRGPPGTFDFLGFTHYWGRAKSGQWVIKRKTARGRFNRALKRIGEWCRLNRHHEVREQHRHLCRALRGHYGYYGIIGNSRSLWAFEYRVVMLWLKWLNRRSQRQLPWARMIAFLDRFPLPSFRVAQTVRVR